ncbi:MAG: COX15/CtaA family protein [Mucilaginibacter sp.]
MRRDNTSLLNVISIISKTDRMIQIACFAVSIMPNQTFENNLKTKIYNNNTDVITWLSMGVGMLMIQILLGGITRLTGSGLSITEWKPLMGALPPLSDEAWKHSFEKYQQIAQFKRVNSHFNLPDYKAIFFWEWLHREWARLMGLVFIVPFVVFLIKKKINHKMVWPMVILFLLGGLQGAIGWIMVKSGLNDTNIAVDHIRLAIHFISALFLLAYLVWFTLKVSIPLSQIVYSPQLKQLNLVLLILLFFQLIYGAFMAGTHAALSAPTWPDMNGVLIPAGIMAANGTLWYNLHSDPITIQFIHRTLAYVIGTLVIIWFFRAGKTPTDLWLYKFRWVPLIFVAVQIILGILALLNSMFKTAIYYSVIHQFTGMLLLTSILITLFLCAKRTKRRSTRPIT